MFAMSEGAFFLQQQPLLTNGLIGTFKFFTTGAFQLKLIGKNARNLFIQACNNILH
jgi:hypothetical protein